MTVINSGGTGKKTKNRIKFSPGGIIPHFGAPLVILALMFSGLTALRATNTARSEAGKCPLRSLDSPSLSSVTSTDDGLPDLAVAAPFED